MATTDAATEAQVGYISSLLRERETDRLTEQQRTFIESFEPSRLNRGQASRVIEGLKKLPSKPRQLTITRTGEPMWPTVPEGRYAVQDPYDGVLKFYKVNRPTEGRWAGRVFIDVRASDEHHPIRDATKRAEIMRVIELDPKEAMLRYGRELGSCGHCGRTLTNELSREIGIGPICRGRMGW